MGRRENREAGRGAGEKGPHCPEAAGAGPPGPACGSGLPSAGGAAWEKGGPGQKGGGLLPPGFGLRLSLGSLKLCPLLLSLRAPRLESDGRAHLSRPWGSNASDAPGTCPPAPRTAQLPPSLGALLEGSQLPGRRDNLVLWGPRCSGNILGERGLKCPPHCPKDLTLVRAGNLEAACQ